MSCIVNQIMCLNVQGMINNFDEVEQLIGSVEPIMLCLTETHLTNDIDNKEVNI